MPPRKWPLHVVAHLQDALEQKHFDCFCAAYFKHTRALSNAERVRVVLDFSTLHSRPSRFWAIASGCPMHSEPHTTSLKIFRDLVVQCEGIHDRGPEGRHISPSE